MKRKAKKIILFTVLVMIALLVSAFFIFLYPLTKMDAVSPYKDPNDYPEYPDYQSEYTQEEHIARLTAITESGAWKDVDNEFSLATNSNGDILSVEVEIVYSLYDKDPEFFLIELIFEAYAKYHIVTGQPYPPATNEAFLFGYIQNDEYYIILLHTGKDPWEYAGYADEKKYFGSYRFAVELNGEMKMIFEITTNQHFLWGSGNIVSRVLSEKTRKDYMEYDYLYHDYRKYEMKEPTVE